MTNDETAGATEQHYAELRQAWMEADLADAMTSEARARDIVGVIATARVPLDDGRSIRVGEIDLEWLQHRIAAAIADARRAALDEAAGVAERTTREPMDYIDWSPGSAADDRARCIAAAIRALKET